MISETIVLKHIARQPKKAAGFKQLVRELGLHGDERRELDLLLRKMVARGTLIASESDRYELPAAAADKNLVAGRLTMHRDGFGFVIPDAKSLTASLKARLTGDIFIPPHLMGNAMHGDLVLVDISERASGWAGGGEDCAAGEAGASDGGGNFSLREPGRICAADRLEDYAGNLDSGGDGAAGDCRGRTKPFTTEDTENTEEEIC